ncbi:hypothetical protein TWF481_002967 [Arthrobotrys musiformis]|uniref:Uncharacterized protein n=1 Tax=Arthrobotrys musiformis TaxID=47236 RepID=A0AAV9VUP2_9PEZI
MYVLERVILVAESKTLDLEEMSSTMAQKRRANGDETETESLSSKRRKLKTPADDIDESRANQEKANQKNQENVKRMIENHLSALMELFSIPENKEILNNQELLERLKKTSQEPSLTGANPDPVWYNDCFKKICCESERILGIVLEKEFIAEFGRNSPNKKPRYFELIDDPTAEGEGGSNQRRKSPEERRVTKKLLVKKYGDRFSKLKSEQKFRCNLQRIIILVKRTNSEFSEVIELYYSTDIKSANTGVDVMDGGTGATKDASTTHMYVLKLRATLPLHTTVLFKADADKASIKRQRRARSQNSEQTYQSPVPAELYGVAEGNKTEKRRRGRTSKGKQYDKELEEKRNRRKEREAKRKGQ